MAWIRPIALSMALCSACEPITVEAPVPETGADMGAAPPEQSDTPFSFFVTSLAAMRALSGSQQGFGGDLRFGEVGDGAGLRGADKICTTIAGASLPSARGRTWRAFLSTSREHAAERIGPGPWYDRRGRLVAADITDLLRTRPLADPTIADDLPNELGMPNSDPEGIGIVDNHDVLTGSDADGRRYGDGMASNCSDWTSRVASGRPRVGHAWKRSASSGAFESFTSAHDAPGCAAGVLLVQHGESAHDGTVGGGGGYGALYCFAVMTEDNAR